MASSEVVTTILQFTMDSLAYMWPVVGALAGVHFVVSWIMRVTFGLGRRAM